MTEMEFPITIHEAKCLMEVLENDIPEHQKSKIALRLLILSANPSLVEKEVISSTPPKSIGIIARYHNNEDCDLESADADEYYKHFYGF